MAAWPFDQEPNVAAITCEAVMNGAPVLLVSHYLDDHSWAFLDGQPWQPSQALIVGMKEVLKVHPDIQEVADLPPGWTATRTGPGSPWTREEAPEE